MTYFDIKKAGKIFPAFYIFMKKIILPVFLLLFLFEPFLYAADSNNEIDKILSSAEALFKTMKKKDYSKIWFFLSDKSKNNIVDDVLKAINKTGGVYTKENINNDFSIGGLIAESYWKSYLENFNPDLVLEESSWQMGKIEKDRAEIIIRYKRSEGPAILKMLKEQGKWVVGLEETFRSSRR